MVAQPAAPVTALRAHQELFTYWTSRKVPGRLPSRADIHPTDFKRHLPTVSLIDVRHEPRSFRVRLAGTGLYGVYGREITGLELEQVYEPAAARYWRDELEKVVDSARPGAGVHSLAWRGADWLSLVWLRLPLSSDGRRVDMILGYDAVVGARDDLPSGIRAA
jgi:hypothetical protein